MAEGSSEGSGHLQVADDAPHITSSRALRERLYLGGGDPGEELKRRYRDAHLLALGLFLEAACNPSFRASGKQLWEMEIPWNPEALQESTGQAGAEQERGFDVLVSVGALEKRDRGDGTYVVPDKRFCTPFPRARDINWEAVTGLLQGKKATLLTFRAFLELLPHLEGAPQPVSLSDVAEVTGYARGMARRGRNELVQTGLLLEEKVSGSAPRYRFAPALLRETSDPADEASSAGSPDEASPEGDVPGAREEETREKRPQTSPPRVSEGTDGGLRLMMGQDSVRVVPPADADVALHIHSDGRGELRIDGRVVAEGKGLRLQNV